MGIEYTLIRSRRKTAAIYVREIGVEVRAPLKMPRRDIDGFVNSKEKWIMDRLKHVADRSQRREAFILDYNSTLLIRGKEYPLEARQGSRAGFDETTVYLPPNLTPDQIKAVCVRLYRQLAKTHLHKRAAYFAEMMGVFPAMVKISGAKTRWGSCSARKSVNFFWRLVMADDDVIDYVVVHELSHLTEMNHSARFWAAVEKVLPDYRKRQARLKELQRRLSMENWD